MRDVASFARNSDKSPSAAEVLWVPMVLWPAAGENFDVFFRLVDADNVLEGAIAEILER